jgi:hypothetical protein
MGGVLATRNARNIFFSRPDFFISPLVVKSSLPHSATGAGGQGTFHSLINWWT